MKLTKHFSLDELTFSDTANRLGIENKPDLHQTANLQTLCIEVLEPIREHFGVPFSPTSGFRCLELNRKLKSKDTSQHVKGQAADIKLPGVSNQYLASWILMNLSVDQILLEFHDVDIPSSGWCHVSFVSTVANRQQALTINKDGVTPGIPETVL